MLNTDSVHQKQPPPRVATSLCLDREVLPTLFIVIVLQGPSLFLDYSVHRGYIALNGLLLHVNNHKKSRGSGNKMTSCRRTGKGGGFLAKKLRGDCSCGFSFVTPHGEDNAVAMMQYYVYRIHKKDYPNGVTKTQAMEHIKETN